MASVTRIVMVLAVPRSLRAGHGVALARTRAGASLGLFDVVPVGPVDVRLVQSKAGGEYFSAMERERITGLTVPSIPGWAPTAQLSNSASTER